MSNYKKLIGAIVGGVGGLLVTWGLLPEAWATPEIAAWITAGLSALLTYLAPPNVATAPEVERRAV